MRSSPNPRAAARESSPLPRKSSRPLALRSSRSLCFYDDLELQLLQTAHVVLAQARGPDAVEEVAAQLSIRHAVAQDVIDRYQDAVATAIAAFFGSAPSRDAPKLRRQ